MSVDQAKTESGIRVITRDEVQPAYDAAENSLPSEFKRRWPVISMDRVYELYPMQWVAMFITEVDEKLRVAAGRIVATASERHLLDEAGVLSAIEREVPDPPFYKFYTGNMPVRLRAIDA